MKRAVFLDRDGTINRAVVRDGHPYPPPDVESLEILPGAAEAVARLHAAGFLTIIVTNQPDVATGVLERDAVEAVNRLICDQMPITGIKVCYATEDAAPDHYKPAPGMLMDAAEEYGVSLRDSFMVGDRWRDVGAGRAAGCFTILIDAGYDEQLQDRPHAVVSSLAQAAELILVTCQEGALETNDR